MIKLKSISFCIPFLLLTVINPTSVFADLPPRPIPPAKPQSQPSTQERPDGATLILVLPVATHPTVTQKSWTYLQWQDDFGMWHDVDGWEGTPTLNAQSMQWEVEWWVGNEHLSVGPFRWVILSNPLSHSGQKVSNPFQLPHSNNTLKTITLE